MSQANAADPPDVPGQAGAPEPPPGHGPEQGRFVYSSLLVPWHDPWRMLLLLIVVPLVGVGGYFAYVNLRAEHNFRQAELARRQRDFAGARRYALANLAARPNGAREHFLLAQVARQTGAFDEAEDHLDECHRLEGATRRIAFERMLLQVQQGAISYQAEAKLRDDLKQGSPDAADILEALSVGCLVGYRFAAAATYLSEWLEQEPDVVQAYLWRSLARERLKEYGPAADDARKALALDPENGEARLRLAQVLLLTTEYQEAAKVLTPLCEREPDNPVAAMALAQAKASLGLTPEAVQILDRLVARFPNDAPVLLERARLALQLNQPAQAEGWLRHAAELVPSDYQVHFTLLRALRQQRKEDQARAIEETVRRLEKESHELDDLMDQFRERPYDPTIRCEIGRVCLRQGNNQQAFHWLKSAHRIAPGHALANQLLAEYYERIGQPAQAAPYRLAARPGMTAGGGLP
jgi:tetratricopeptide (TPR) repeat protein